VAQKKNWSRKKAIAQEGSKKGLLKERMVGKLSRGKNRRQKRRRKNDAGITVPRRAKEKLGDKCLVHKEFLGEWRRP